MINEEKLRNFLSRWIKIPDEMANQQMNNELEDCFGVEIKKPYNIEDMKTIIEEFVNENFCITGCKFCAETGNGEIMPDDHKGSYDRAITKLEEQLKKYFEGKK